MRVAVEQPVIHHRTDTSRKNQGVVLSRDRALQLSLPCCAVGVRFFLCLKGEGVSEVSFSLPHCLEI